ncbi:unnamed protein product [Prorocentrum cordatum]|uniref:PNPLA domain-containing protein n=1 Tax=Prorocentrum cordatum TaxID=2364126 RepID=A0ABN9TKF9_9DINO|nr:unnamed protein product [Polarella glacialis]
MSGCLHTWWLSAHPATEPGVHGPILVGFWPAGPPPTSYACGVLLALGHGDASVQRAAGANAGALAGFVMTTGQFDASVRFGMAVACTLEKYPWMRPGPMWDFFCRRCALRAPVPAEGSLAVSMTELVSPLPPRGVNRLVSTFESKEALGEALVASAAVPWLTCRGPWAAWRGSRWLDGGLTNGVPHFRDGRRPQLVIRYDFLERRPRGRCRGIYLRPADVLELIGRGVDDGAALLAGERPPGLKVLSPEEAVQVPPAAELTLLSAPRLAWSAMRGLVLKN